MRNVETSEGVAETSGEDSEDTTESDLSVTGQEDNRSRSNRHNKKSGEPNRRTFTKKNEK